MGRRVTAVVELLLSGVLLAGSAACDTFPLFETIFGGETAELELQINGCPEEGLPIGRSVEFALNTVPESADVSIETSADCCEIINGDTFQPTVTPSEDASGSVIVTLTATTADGVTATDTCTFDTCIPLCVDDTECDDGLFCTGEEHCTVDRCPADCRSSGSPCAEDEVCNEVAKRCDRMCNVDADCDDGDENTVDTCADTDEAGIRVCHYTLVNEPVDLIPEDGIATDIALAIYSDGWGELLDTQTLETEGAVTIDIEEEMPYSDPPAYYLYATATGFYTELYKCVKGETITIDLDAVPDHAEAVAGTIFGTQGFFADSPVAEHTLQITNSANTFSATTTTDVQGRFGLSGLPPGDYTLAFDYCQFNDDEKFPVSFDVTNTSGVDYYDLQFPEPAQADAPNLYLYPTTTMDMSVSVGVPSGGYITDSQPPYQAGWQVHARPDGTINGVYGYLFYEAMVSVPLNRETGWVLRGEKLEAELRTLLAELGFEGREIDDFVNHWVPILEGSAWYAVYPQNAEAVTTLTITPSPDSILRAILLIRPLDHRITIPTPPNCDAFVREGFTVVEWGVIVL